VAREDQLFLYQSLASGKEGKVRGSYDYVNNIIRLTKAADYSTFVHESAHFDIHATRKRGKYIFCIVKLCPVCDIVCRFLIPWKSQMDLGWISYYFSYFSSGISGLAHQQGRNIFYLED
jgi:hypothetical protein